MDKVNVAAFLGFISPLFYMLGAEPFEIPGQNSPQELLGGGIAVAVYFAACHVWLLWDEPLESRAYWSVPIVMLLAVVFATFLVTMAESARMWLNTGLPMFAGGAVGALVAIAGRRIVATLRQRRDRRHEARD